MSITRLRAEVHRLNGQFAAHMRDNGSKRKITNTTVFSFPSINSSASDSGSELEDEQMLVTKGELNAWVLEASYYLQK